MFLVLLRARSRPNPHSRPVIVITSLQHDENRTERSRRRRLKRLDDINAQILLRQNAHNALLLSLAAHPNKSPRRTRSLVETSPTTNLKYSTEFRDYELIYLIVGTDDSLSVGQTCRPTSNKGMDGEKKSAEPRPLSGSSSPGINQPGLFCFPAGEKKIMY